MVTPTPTPTTTPTPPVQATPTPTPATPTPKAKSTPTPTPGAKPAYESTITPAGGANQNATPDADADTQKRERLWDVLTQKRPGCPQISDDNQKKITPFSHDLLNNLACVASKSGMLSVYNPEGGKPIFDMTPGGAIGIRRNWDLNDKTQLTSTDHIDALLKGSAVAKMSMGDAGASLSSPSDQSRAMMEKAAQLAHLKIDNPKYAKPEDLEAALKAIDPNLSAKMTSQWNAMKGESILKPIVQPAPATTTPTPTATPGAVTPTATPGAATPKTALAVTTADNINALEKSGKPLVLMVYDPSDPAQVKKIDALAATAGDNVVVAKMTHDDMEKLKSSLGADDPLHKSLDAGNNLFALDSSGKIVHDQGAAPADLQPWAQKYLGATTFPTPAAAVPTPVAPNPSLAPGQR